MYVAAVPNRSSPPAILLRESYREGGKARSRTLANLSDWPAEKVEALRAVLRNEPLVPAGQAGGIEICRSLPHGTSPPRSPPPAVSGSMSCCPGAARRASAASRSL